MKLDYTIESVEERKKIVEQILEETPDPSEAYLEALANYLIMCMEKQEKKEKKILTENRLSTIDKREVSYEGLTMQFENGEDGVYNLITNDKNIIFKPKIKITKHDIETIPFLRQLVDGIHLWEKALPSAEGRNRYIIKKALIEMRKDQYIIKDAFTKPIETTKFTSSIFSPKLEENININPFSYEGATLVDPKVVSALLIDYSKLKADSYKNIRSDTWCIMHDLSILIDKALAPHPKLKRILELKINNYQNIEIQKIIENEFNETHSLEYFSTIWRNKIPSLIADVAKKEYYTWYYSENEPGKWKKCTRCGEIKLASNLFFSKNTSSKDGWYSICKDCRKNKGKNK